MNPRERILTTFSHEVPDHLPSFAWWHPEVVTKLKEHYATSDFDDVLADLGIEGWESLGVRIVNPEFERKATERPAQVPWHRAIWLDQWRYTDSWGVKFKLGESEWYEERLEGPLDHAESLEEVTAYRFPDLSQIAEPEDYAQQVADLKAQHKVVTASISNPYKTAWLLRGMDNVLADYLINPDILSYLYDRIYELSTEMCRRMAHAGVDMIEVIGDFAMQDRITMGPESWRKFDKPRLADLISEVKAVNPDVFMFVHSDGNVMDLMDDIVEIGFDIVNPIQPECMDPAEVKRRWGDRITLHGGVSIQKTFPYGTPQEVKREIEELIRTCGYNGGLVVFPSNVVQPDTPVENIQACFHTVRDYDMSEFIA